jgi:hypothetical protein
MRAIRRGPGRIADPMTDAAADDAWFRAKVREALEDPRPAIPHAEVEAHFAGRRARVSPRPPLISRTDFEAAD